MAKRILIAEDNAGCRELITIHAKAHGYDFVTVTNGADLLTIASKEKFDVVITDLKMPDLNGASATEIMKLQGNTTPVIALTGLASHEILLVESKFAKVFFKPCNYNYLFKYVKLLLD